MAYGSEKSWIVTATAGCLKTLFFTEMAHASAWTLPKNEGYQSLNVGYEQGDFGNNWRQDSYLEFGLTKDWTVTGKLETVWREQFNYGDRSSGEIGIRREVWSKDDWHVSTQTTLFVGEYLDEESCGGLGAELGAAIGYSRQVGNSPVYAFVESSAGARQGCEHVTLDAVIGTAPAQNWDVQLKAFSEQYPGREFTKLEFGVSRKFEKNYLGVGVRQEVSGAFDENSVFMSIWRKF